MGVYKEYLENGKTLFLPFDFIALGCNALLMKSLGGRMIFGKHFLLRLK